MCELLAGVGASFVNLAHQGQHCGGKRSVRWREWDALAERVCRAAEIAREHGLQAAFHPHAGTWVETRDDLEALLSGRRRRW